MTILPRLPHPPQAFEPFLLIHRRDGSFSVAAGAPDGTIELAPLRVLPDPPRRKPLECPCCDRWIVLNEFADGTMRLEPLSKPLHDEDERL